MAAIPLGYWLVFVQNLKHKFWRVLLHVKKGHKDSQKGGPSSKRVRCKTVSSSSSKIRPKKLQYPSMSFISTIQLETEMSRNKMYSKGVCISRNFSFHLLQQVAVLWTLFKSVCLSWSPFVFMITAIKVFLKEFLNITMIIRTLFS